MSPFSSANSSPDEADCGGPPQNQAADWSPWEDRMDVEPVQEGGEALLLGLGSQGPRERGGEVVLPRAAPPVQGAMQSPSQRQILASRSPVVSPIFQAEDFRGAFVNNLEIRPIQNFNSFPCSTVNSLPGIFSLPCARGRGLPIWVLFLFLSCRKWVSTVPN